MYSVLVIRDMFPVTFSVAQLVIMFAFPIMVKVKFSRYRPRPALGDPVG
jgi:hypothetical protein